MIYKKPSETQLKKARLKTIEKEFKTMLEDEFLRRRSFADGYSPWMTEKILQIGEQGGGRAKMMKEIGVRTVSTFHKWMDENIEFKDAYELSQVYCQAYLEDLLLQKSTGMNEAVDPKALSMLMAARFPEYKKEVSTKNEVNINLTEVNKLDDQTLTERIKGLQSKLGLGQSNIIEGECVEIKD